MNEFEIARLKFKPEKIKYLLVAEAPPKLDSKRFFYFENVFEKDSLFIEITKCLFENTIKGLEISAIRNIKRAILEKFASSGFYLIDSLDSPFEDDLKSKQKILLLQAAQNELLNKIKSVANEETKVILISATVFRANQEFLLNNKINVINSESIDFPGSGGQKKFREKFEALLRKCNYKEE